MNLYPGVLEKMGEDRSHGSVWLKRFDDLPPGAARVFALHFEAGSRTHWHVHAGRQVMYGIYGRGCVHVRGEESVIVEPGDVIYLDPGAKHWHGAAPDHEFIHTVIAFDTKTFWKFRQELGSAKPEPEPVSTDVYDAAFG